MHNIILKLFGMLKSLLHFLKIVCVMCIILLLLFWIQNLTKTEWGWIGFITPFLNWLLDIGNALCSISFNLFDTIVELKYLSATIILLLAILVIHGILILTNIFEGGYKSARYICKKTEEAFMNKSLQASVAYREKKLSKYKIFVTTSLKEIKSPIKQNIDLNEQNQLMIKYIKEKLNITPTQYQNGFMYSFNNFDKIDDILPVFFKVLNSTAPIQYCICVQIGDDLKELNKLIGLEIYGKIIMTSTTSFRYSYNTIQNYSTSLLGEFKNDQNTIDVYEFVE